jgi:hypothetical protein
VYHPQPQSRIPFQLVQAKVPRVVDAPTSLNLKLLVASSFISERADPAQGLTTHFSYPHGSSDSALHDLQPSGFEGLIKCLLAPLICSSVSDLSCLCHCYIAGHSIASSQPLVLYDHVPYAVQEWHSRLSICGWQPTFFETHHRPGSISSAVGGTQWLEINPHITPTVL